MEAQQNIVQEISKPSAIRSFGKPYSNSLFIQPKLTINTPGDTYEQEADTMADKVMRMAIPSKNDTFFKPAIAQVQRKHHDSDELEDLRLHRKEMPTVQRKCAACEEEDHVHRKENSNSIPQGNNALDSYVSSLSSSGQSLPEASRQFFEPRFRQDFSNVKIHTDSVAAKSAQSINALAYTTGNNIVFNQGQYSPNTESGQRLMAHELTHVVQQANRIQPYRPQDSLHYGLGEESFNLPGDTESKSWIKKITVNLTGTRKDITRAHTMSTGSAKAEYYNNKAHLPDINIPQLVGGSPELGLTNPGTSYVYRIEGEGFNSSSLSGSVDLATREGPDNLYSKDGSGNMDFALFFNAAGQALHVGSLNNSSHGCIHVNEYYMRQMNYHSVKGATQVVINQLSTPTNIQQPTPTPAIQRKCAACEGEGKVHRKENSNSEIQGSNELGSYVSSLSSSGQSLPESSRSFFEPRFGQDFPNVKIHSDSVAAKSAQSINALAYTTGNNIVFNEGQYSPNSESGQRLMAHELTHVVQQQQSYVQKKDDPASGEKADAKSNDYESTIQSMTENALMPGIGAAKWGFHFIEGIEESSLPEKMHQSVDAFKSNLNSAGNIASFYFGINAGVPEGVAEDLYANIKGIIMLAVKIMESEYSFYTDPMGFFDSVTKDLLSLWEVIRTDPKILGKLAGDALATKVNEGFVKADAYHQGEALGEILGEIVTEIALLFIGVEEVSAVAKFAEGTEIGAKLISALNKSETLGKVAKMLGTGNREAEIVNDANKTAKIAEAAKAAGELEKLENSVGKVSAETEEMLKKNEQLRNALLENEKAAKLLKLCNSPCFPDFATTEQIQHISEIIERAEIHGIDIQQMAIKEFLHDSPDVGALGERIEQIDEELSRIVLDKPKGEHTFILDELTKTEKLRNTPGVVSGGKHLRTITPENAAAWFENLEKEE